MTRSAKTRNKKPSFTKQQIAGLKFFEVEARDTAEALFMRPPPTRTRNWLLAHEYLHRAEQWFIGGCRYRLSPKGYDALNELKARKHKRARS